MGINKKEAHCAEHETNNKAIKQWTLSIDGDLTYQFLLDSSMLLFSLSEISLESVLVGLGRPGFLLRGRSGIGGGSHDF
jgi:hypothetical protein